MPCLDMLFCVWQGPLAAGTSIEAELDEAACASLMHALNRSAAFSP